MNPPSPTAALPAEPPRSDAATAVLAGLTKSFASTLVRSVLFRTALADPMP